MQGYIPLFWDLALAVILASTMMICSRRGLIRSVVDLAGYFAMLWISYTFSGKASDIVYDVVFRERVEAALREKISESASGSELIAQIGEALSELPSPIDALFGSAKPELLESFESDLAQRIGSVTQAVADGVVEPMATGILQVVFFLLIFGVGMFIVKLMSSALSQVNRLPLIGRVNMMLGGILGLAEGVIIIMVLTVALSLFLTLAGNSSGFISQDIIEKTYLLKFFFENNPFI